MGPVVSGGREGSVGRFVRVNAGPVVRGARVPPSPVVVSTLLRVAAVFVFAVVLAIVLRGGSVRAGNVVRVPPLPVVRGGSVPRVVRFPAGRLVREPAGPVVR